MCPKSIARSVSLFTLTLVAVGALVSAANAGGGDSGANQRLFFRAGEPDQLAWVSAEMATTEDGLIDWSLLSEDIRSSYEELQKWQAFAIGRNEDGTPIYDSGYSHALPGFGSYWGPSYYDGINQPPSETLDDLVSNARYIVEGVVTDREQGFFIDEPMTLLTLRVSRIVAPKQGDNILPRFRTPVTNVLYVAYPSARFTIGGHGFAKGDPSYPPLPEIGDSILFFELTLALDVDRLVFRPDADKVLVQSPGGTLDPDDYQKEWIETHNRGVPATLEEVAEKVAQDRAFESIRSTGSGS